MELLDPRSIGRPAIYAAVVLQLAGCIVVEGPRPDPMALPVRICQTAGELPKIAHTVARLQEGSSWRIAEECAVPDWPARHDPVLESGAAEMSAENNRPQLIRRIPKVLVTPLAPPRRPGEQRSQ